MGHKDEFDIESSLEDVAFGSLDEAGWSQLAEAIESDPELVLSYLEAVHFAHSLKYYAESGSMLANKSADREDSVLEGKASLSYLGRSHEVHPSSDGKSSRRITFSPLGLAAVLCVAAAVSFVAAGLWHVRLAPEGIVSGEQSSVAGALRQANRSFSSQDHRFFGAVSSLSLEASANGLMKPLKVGQRLHCGEVVQLDSGQMKVDLYDGASVLVEGPAEFMLAAPDEVFIRMGRIVATGSKPFVVRSSTATVSCQGGEIAFGMSLDRVTTVLVYRGTSSLTVSSADGNRLRLVHEGQGFSIVPPSEEDGDMRVREITVPPSYIRDWGQVVQSYGNYEKVVLADQPSAYWPLYNVRKHWHVLDLTQNGYDGIAIGSWPAQNGEARSIADRGAVFNGKSYIECDRKPDLALDTGFTVEAWAKVADCEVHRALFTSRWTLAHRTPSQEKLGFTLFAAPSRHWEFWTGAGNRKNAWNILRSAKRAELDVWTHVVVKFEPESQGKEPIDNGFMRGVATIYIDGQESARGIHDMSVKEIGWPAQIGAAESVPESITSWLFIGELRDIAVYDYPLSEERIRDHYATLTRESNNRVVSSRGPTALDLEDSSIDERVIASRLNRPTTFRSQAYQIKNSNVTYDLVF